MKKITLTLITLLAAIFLIAPTILADSGTMQAANALYENGHYPEAIRAYENLVNQGVADTNLYYNLGNAYYQSGDVGPAILNYRRAEQLAPRDSDIQHNLTLARQQTADQFNQTPNTIITIFLAEATEWISLNETAVITLALWTMLGLLILAIRKLDSGRRKTGLKYSLIPVALLFALAAFTLGSRISQANDAPDAIIVAQTADVYAGPGQQFGSDFQLHSGAEVNLFQERGDWAQIGVPGLAARGWVNVNGVATVETDD
ncbi:MAG: tetratricopeptide repeat protein [Chloroflexi bacterium]|nr:tetratricopeptide repeat protein [Chloroflexota bacterium]